MPPGIRHNLSCPGDSLGRAAYPREILARDLQNTVQRTTQTRLCHLVRGLKGAGSVQDLGRVQQQVQRPLPISTLSLHGRHELRTHRAHCRYRLGLLAAKSTVVAQIRQASSCSHSRHQRQAARAPAHTREPSTVICPTWARRGPGENVQTSLRANRSPPTTPKRRQAPPPGRPAKPNTRSCHQA